MTDAQRPGAPIGNQNAHVVHGGEGAIKTLSSGAELRGLAAQSQNEVERELEADGRSAIVRRAAIRLEAVSRLFYNAILAATEHGDLGKLASYSQRFAWLQARALAAWAQVAHEEKSDGRGASAKEVLSAIKGGESGSDQ